MRETFGFTKPREEKTFDDYVQGIVEKLNKTGNEYAAIYHTFQIMVLVASGIVPVINALIPSDNPELIKQYTSILAFTGAISVGILQLTQARERWTLERVTKVTIERERNLYNNNARPYEAYADMDSIKRQLYVERVMRIIINKFNRFYAIGRPSGQEEEGDEDRKKHPESVEETKTTRTPPQNKSQNGGKDDGST